MVNEIVSSLSMIQIPIKRKTINRMMKVGGLPNTQDVRFGDVNLNGQKKVLLRQVIDLLNHDEIAGLVEKGQLAFGVLRPKVFESHIETNDDDRAADVLLCELPPPVKTFFTMPIVFNREMTHRFWYKPEYQEIPPIKFTMFANVWDEFVSMMTAGASTIYLAHSPLSHTVQFLREKIGPWKDPPSETIRGKFAKKEQKGIVNNLIHLSDQENIITELKIISEELKKIL